MNKHEENSENSRTSKWYPWPFQSCHMIQSICWWLGLRWMLLIYLMGNGKSGIYKDLGEFRENWETNRRKLRKLREIGERIGENMEYLREIWKNWDLLVQKMTKISQTFGDIERNWTNLEKCRKIRANWQNLERIGKIWWKLSKHSKDLPNIPSRLTYCWFLTSILGKL